MKQVTIESVKQRIADLESAGKVVGGLSLSSDFELACLRELVAVTERAGELNKALDVSLRVQVDQANRISQMLDEIKRAESAIGSLGWMSLDTAISLELSKLNKQISDLQEQVRLLTEQRDSVAVESAIARERHRFIRALAVSILEHSGGRHDWRGAMEDASELIKTVDGVYSQFSATDAAIAALRADAGATAIEQFALLMRSPGDDPFLDAVAEGVAVAADNFARQLRESKGEVSNG